MTGVAWLLASSLFTATTPEAERARILGALFDPLPGTRLIVENKSVPLHKDQPFLIKGDMHIRPPKGQCVTLRRDFNKPDQRICKATYIPWDVYELDAMGRLNLQVLIDEEWDDGIHLSWPTDYRVASSVAVGDAATKEGESENHEDIPIRTCKAEDRDGERTIILESFAGKKWFISLPDFDEPVDGELEAVPNLVMDKTGDRSDPNAPIENGLGGGAGGKPSILSQMLSGNYKKKESQTLKFRLPRRNAFEMESGRFTETGSPRGMQGRCRYKFSGAPGDPESGAIECLDTDTFDAFYVHVTCFPKWQPRIKSDKK